MAREIHRSGFSLIELLVVISIIAILAAMLLPAISTVKDMASRTRCATQMRQIAMGIVAYRGENESLYPMVYGDTNAGKNWWDWAYQPSTGRWQHFIDPYVENYEVFNCQVAKKKYQVGAIQETPAGGYQRGSAIGGGPGGWCTTLIAYNQQTWGRSSSFGTPKGPMTEDKVDSYLKSLVPGATRDRCPMLFDGLWRNDGSGDVLPWPNRQKSPLDGFHYLYWIHRERSNMAFADGHYENVAFADVSSFDPLLLK